MVIVLMFLAVVSGVLAVFVLWPYGPILALLAAPVIASLMTVLGAFLITSRPPAGHSHPAPSVTSAPAGDRGP
jgi:hypothetical protein